MGEIHKGGWCPRPLQSQTSGGGSKYRGADGHNDNDRIQKTNFGFLPFSADAGRTHAVAPLGPQFDQTGAEQADGKTNKQNIRISSTIELKMPPSPHTHGRFWEDISVKCEGGWRYVNLVVAVTTFTTNGGHSRPLVKIIIDKYLRQIK